MQEAFRGVHRGRGGVGSSAADHPIHSWLAMMAAGT